MPKAKQKEKGPHSVGVIVTHPEEHVTPGRSQILWVVVMLMIILLGGLASFYIWSENERLGNEMDAPYMQDQNGVVSKFLKSMSAKVNALKKENDLGVSNTTQVFKGSRFSLAYPSNWFVWNRVYNPPFGSVAEEGFFSDKPIDEETMNLPLGGSDDLRDSLPIFYEVFPFGTDENAVSHIEEDKSEFSSLEKTNLTNGVILYHFSEDRYNDPSTSNDRYWILDETNPKNIFALMAYARSTSIDYSLLKPLLEKILHSYKPL